MHYCTAQVEKIPIITSLKCSYLLNFSPTFYYNFLTLPPSLLPLIKSGCFIIFKKEKEKKSQLNQFSTADKIILPAVRSGDARTR